MMCRMLWGGVTDIEEALELLLADHAVVVGVHSVEEERQWSLQRLLHGRIVHQLAHAVDELVLADALAAANSTQVLVPNLQRGRHSID